MTKIFWRGGLLELENGLELIEGLVYLRKISVDEERAFNLPTRRLPEYYLVLEFIDVDDNWYEILSKILLSLQLSKNNMIFIETIFMGNNTYHQKVNPYIDLPNMPFAAALGPEEFEISKELLTHLLKIDYESNLSMRIACERFSKTHSSRSLLDQIIDACISYEALFLQGKKFSANRRHVVSKACSELLGKSREERGEIKRIVNDGFMLRNSIVHGSQSDADLLHSTHTAFTEYLRLSIIQKVLQTG